MGDDEMTMTLRELHDGCLVAMYEGAATIALEIADQVMRAIERECEPRRISQLRGKHAKWTAIRDASRVEMMRRGM